MREMTKDVKTGFLTQPVIGLLKPVIYGLSDYMMSHVTWLIVGCRPNVSIWGALHSKTGLVFCILNLAIHRAGLVYSIILTQVLGSCIRTYVTSAQSLPVFRSCLKMYLFSRCFLWLRCCGWEVTLSYSGTLIVFLTYFWGRQPKPPSQPNAQTGCSKKRNNWNWLQVWWDGIKPLPPALFFYKNFQN